MNEKKYTMILLASSLLAGGVTESWAVLGIGWAVWAAVVFSIRWGERIPVLELAQMLAGLQWIIAPILIYHLPDVEKYPMEIPQAYYLSIVVPAYLCFCFGITLFNVPVRYLPALQEKPEFLKVLLAAAAIGYGLGLTPLAGSTFPHMLSELLGCSVIFAMYRCSKRTAWILFGIFVFLLLLESLSWGGFHALLIWFFWLGSFLLHRIGASRKTVLASLVLAVLAVSVFQGVKWQYRDAERSGSLRDWILFAGMSEDWLTDGKLRSTLQDEDFLLRFNQGWHISQVIIYMDVTGNYLRGSSIADSVGAILLPRYLFPDKRRGGGAENFRTMTFHELVGGTSMNVSYVGEGYGNWGKSGCSLFLLGVGCLLGLALRLVKWMNEKDGFYFYFIPVLFFFGVKAEGDFMMTFGQFFKLFLIAWVLIRLFGRRFVNCGDGGGRRRHVPESLRLKG